MQGVMSSEKEKIHRCKQNWYVDVEIRYEKINVEQWSWVLEQSFRTSHNKTDNNLSDDDLENIVSSDKVLISYCPFCGCNLTKLKKNTW